MSTYAVTLPRLKIFAEAAKSYDQEVLSHERLSTPELVTKWSKTVNAISDLQQRYNIVKKADKASLDSFVPFGIATPSCRLTEVRVAIGTIQANSFPIIVVSLGNPCNETITRSSVADFFQSRLSIKNYSSQDIPPDHPISDLRKIRGNDACMSFKPTGSIIYAPNDQRSFVNNGATYKAIYQEVELLFTTKNRYTSLREEMRFVKQ